jgi:hypothetical protein
MQKGLQRANDTECSVTTLNEQNLGNSKDSTRNGRKEIPREHAFSLRKKPFEQYPSFQSNTGASDLSTA